MSSLSLAVSVQILRHRLEGSLPASSSSNLTSYAYAYAGVVGNLIVLLTTYYSYLDM